MLPPIPRNVQKSNILIYILTVLAVTFWGISYVWTRIALDFYGPVTIMFIRLSLSSLLMFGISRTMRLGQKIHARDRKSFVLLAFFSPFCYFLGENFGVFHVSPTLASVIIATIPVFAPILGYVAFRERLSVMNILGFLVSFTGVMVMVLDTNLQFTASPRGILWLSFAVLSALVNIVFLKKLAARYSSFTIIRSQNLLGALFFLPVFLILDYPDVLHIRPSHQAIGSLLALAIFGSTLAFMFYTSAVRAIGIARTSIFANLIPVVTAITSLIILREVIDLSRIVGMLIVISGLFMTQASGFRRWHRARKK